jgi:hypothetical protein
MMEPNADFLSRLINQIRQQGAIAITLGSGTRLIATWKQDAAAVPTIEVKVMPPQSIQESADDSGQVARYDLRPRMLCPQCRGDREVFLSGLPCPVCNGNGWVYQE